jgi:hypothetical protein
MEVHFSENLEEHVDRLNHIMESIPRFGVSLLTGSNGSGKSLIRSQLTFTFAKQDGKLKDGKIEKGYRPIASISMQLRTSSNPEWSALSSIMQDTSWVPTSSNTFHLIEGVLKTEKFIIIDEPEIGMSDETVMGLVDHLNGFIDNKPDVGLMVITHNRYIVENLHSTHFFNCDGFYTKEDWLNRKLVKTDLKKLEENKLFFYIRDLNKKKKK